MEPSRFAAPVVVPTSQRLLYEARRLGGFLKAEEAAGKRIGVVTSIVGIWQYRIVFSGSGEKWICSAVALDRHWVGSFVP